MCLGIPGQIVEITDTERKLALIDMSGVKREINITCIVGKDAAIADYVGEWVLVSMGFASVIIDQAEAAATLKVLNELSEIQERFTANLP